VSEFLNKGPEHCNNNINNNNNSNNNNSSNKDNSDELHELRLTQATVNVGVIGHVAHGKSTLVRHLTGVTTGKSSREQKRNCTIQLGYANVKIWECGKCGAHSYSSSKPDTSHCAACNTEMQLLQHVSFVDCPGHDAFISTMINGTAVMDAAVLVISAAEACPQPQTEEHLAAAELMGIKRFVIVQNKVDLCDSADKAEEHARSIERFVKGTAAEGAPIIPTVAQTGVNMDAVVEALAALLPAHTDPVDLSQDELRMNIVRTFKVNAPGCTPARLCGGILGGSIASGVARIGDVCEIRPGTLLADGSVQPLFTAIGSMRCEATPLECAVPGGLIGICTGLDPMLCMNDRLVGHVAGAPGTLPPVWHTLQSSFVPVVLEDIKGKGSKVKLTKGDTINVHVGTLQRQAEVIRKADQKDGELGKVILRLSAPVCAAEGQRVTFFKGTRLVGFGNLQKGKPSWEVDLPPAPAAETLQALTDQAIVTYCEIKAKVVTEEAPKDTRVQENVEVPTVNEPVSLHVRVTESKPSSKEETEEAWCDPTALLSKKKKKKKTDAVENNKSTDVGYVEEAAKSEKATCPNVEVPTKATACDVSAAVDPFKAKKKKKKKAIKTTAESDELSRRDKEEDCTVVGGSNTRTLCGTATLKEEKSQSDTNQAENTASAVSSPVVKGAAATDLAAVEVEQSESMRLGADVTGADVTDMGATAQLSEKDMRRAATIAARAACDTRCHFYPEELPCEGDLVVVAISQITDMGVHVTLPEYSCAPGFIPLRELTRKNRIRNVRALVPEGSETVCSVSRVEEGHMELSMARVTKAEAYVVKQKYREASTAHAVLRRAAEIIRQPLRELYQNVAWPLMDSANEHGATSVYEALRLCVNSPATMLRQLGDGSEVGNMQDAVLSEAARRMPVRVLRCHATVDVRCFTPDGIGAVRQALLAGEAAAERAARSCNAQLKFEVQLVSPPVYAIELTCRDASAAADVMWSVVDEIRAEAGRVGASFDLQTAPMIKADGLFAEQPLDAPKSVQVVAPEPVEAIACAAEANEEKACVSLVAATPCEKVAVEAVEPSVHVRLISLGRRKVTVLEGLGQGVPGLDLAAMCSALKARFSCNGTIIKEKGAPMLQLSGDQRLGVRAFLLHEGILLAANIHMHGGGGGGETQSPQAPVASKHDAPGNDAQHCGIQIDAGEEAAPCGDTCAPHSWGAYGVLADRCFGNAAWGAKVPCKLPAPKVLVRPKLTQVANFSSICHAVGRSCDHVKLFIEAELATSTSLQGDGCGLVIRGRFKEANIISILRSYVKEYVKCAACGRFATTMERKQSIRADVLCCPTCTATRALAPIKAATYHAQVGRRR